MFVFFTNAPPPLTPHHHAAVFPWYIVFINHGPLLVIDNAPTSNLWRSGVGVRVYVCVCSALLGVTKYTRHGVTLNNSTPYTSQSSRLTEKRYARVSKTTAPWCGDRRARVICRCKRGVLGVKYNSAPHPVMLWVNAFVRARVRARFLLLFSFLLFFSLLFPSLFLLSTSVADGSVGSCGHAAAACLNKNNRSCHL